MMFKVQKCCYFIMIYCAAVEAIETPDLTIISHCENVTASWSDISDAKGYELWYQPADESQDWNYLDINVTNNEYSASLWNGANYYVSLLAYNDLETSQFSPINLLWAGDFLLPPVQKITINNQAATLSWNPIDQAQYYELWYKPMSISRADWNYIEISKNQHSLSVDLSEGSYFKTTMLSVGANGFYSRFSNFVDIVVGEKAKLGNNYHDTLYPEEVIGVFPAEQDSPYHAVLQDCVYSRQRTQSCKLKTLPLLGQEFSQPSIDNIMDRTLVSHAWMAQRFKNLLQKLPVESLLLFRAVTAIVISGDVRPAYYQSRTGAIYLDPNVLLMSTDSREMVDNVDKTPDFRSDCGDSLNFWQVFRYVKDGEYAYHKEIDERSLDDLVFLLGDVLFHELAHANDVFPPSTLSSLVNNQSVHKAADANISNKISYQVLQQFPLASDLLHYQADVMYACSSATCQQTVSTAQQITAEFIKDSANDTYSYSSHHEDVAMLAEEVMMRYFLGAVRDVAITPVPQTEDPTAGDIIVEWGQRGRVTNPFVKNKVKFIMHNLLPEVDFSSYLDSLPAPINMRVGESWRDNLNVGKMAKSKKLKHHTQQKPERYISYQ